MLGVFRFITHFQQKNSKSFLTSSYLDVVAQFLVITLAPFHIITTDNDVFPRISYHRVPIRAHCARLVLSQFILSRIHALYVEFLLFTVTTCRGKKLFLFRVLVRRVCIFINIITYALQVVGRVCIRCGVSTIFIACEPDRNKFGHRRD